jgi:hypothetical protein
MIRMRLLALALLLSLPLAADTISPAPPLFVPDVTSTCGQPVVSAASDGRQFVAYEDAESAAVVNGVPQPRVAPSIEPDPNGLTIAWTEPDVVSRAMIGGIDSNGAVRAPRLLASPVDVRTRVRLARGLTSAMAVWSDGSSVFAQELNDGGFWGVLIPLGAGKDPGVAFDGEEWLVVWSNGEQPAQIMSAQIHSRLLRGPLFHKVSPSSLAQTGAVVASRGTDFLVVWQENAAVNTFTAAYVDRNSFTSSPAMILAGSEAVATLDVAASGRLYLVAIQTAFGNFNLPPTSTIPDILVSGTHSPGVQRVRPRPDGGFDVLSEGIDRPLRFTIINKLGDITVDTRLPLRVDSADFVENDGRVTVAYSTAPDRQLVLQKFTLRRRIAGMR